MSETKTAKWYVPIDKGISVECITDIQIVSMVIATDANSSREISIQKPVTLNILFRYGTVCE